MTDRHIAFQSASQLLQSLERMEISSRELLDLYLARVETYNPTFNSVVALDTDNARKAAQAADDARARRQPLGPLAGLPITIKDSFEVVGMPTTCGLSPLAHYFAERDADAVERLRRAGAIVFGKTNVPGGLCDWQTHNPIYGLTRNPWNPDRTAGGSSGGSAVAVASGLTGVDLGSDFAGSNRLPAHFCGVLGHRPSYGVVPFRGHIPPMPGSLAAPEMAVAGPLARSSTDLRIMLEVLAGANEVGMAGWRLSLPPSRHSHLKDFRVAVWTGSGPFLIDETYRQTFAGFVENLGPIVGQLSETVPPVDVAENYDLYLNTVFAIVGRYWPIGKQGAESELMSREARDYASRINGYITTSASEWFALQDRRERSFLAFREFFRDHDVLLCPAAITVAFEHDTDRPQLFRTLSVSGEERSYLNNFAWPSIAACSNLPATVMPTGQFVDGLPAGIQIIGPNLEDFTPIHFAQLVETELGGFVAPPSLAY
jgi:amidase